MRITANTGEKHINQNLQKHACCKFSKKKIKIKKKKVYMDQDKEDIQYHTSQIVKSRKGNGGSWT